MLRPWVFVVAVVTVVADVTVAVAAATEGNSDEQEQGGSAPVDDVLDPGRILSTIDNPARSS